MWSYYGAKGKLAHLYPRPKQDLIIEPFAGSARYSLEHFEKDVLLIDKYSIVIDVWHYLQQASPQDILGLPHLQRGQSTEDFELSDIERKFLGFLVCNGVESPRKKVASFEGVNVSRDLRNIAGQLFKIRHWKIQLGCYKDIPNQSATWFIDPPYFKGGEHYKISSKHLNYSELAKWCKSRNGQIIVCENSSASWLPFMELKTMHGSVRTTKEVFWTNERVEQQCTLF